MVSFKYIHALAVIWDSLVVQAGLTSLNPAFKGLLDSPEHCIGLASPLVPTSPRVQYIANKTCVLQIAPVCMTENLGTKNLTLFSM